MAKLPSVWLLALAPESLDNKSGTESEWSPLVSSGRPKWLGGQTAVPIILTIDRARSVLRPICLVCQVKGAPLALVGTKSINKPSTDLQAFPRYCPWPTIIPAPSVGIII